MGDEDSGHIPGFDPEYHDLNPNDQGPSNDQEKEMYLKWTLNTYVTRTAAINRLNQSSIKKQSTSSAATQKSIESQLKYWLWRRKSIVSAVQLPDGDKYFLKFIPTLHHEKHTVPSMAIKLKEKLGEDQEYLNRIIHRTYFLAKDAYDHISVTKFIKRIIFDTLADVMAIIRVKFVIDAENPALTMKVIDVYPDAMVDATQGYAVKKVKTDDRGEVVLPINPYQPSMAVSTCIVDILEVENIVTYFVQNRSYTVGITSVPDVIQRRLSVLDADPNSKISIVPVHTMSAAEMLEIITPDMQSPTMLEHQAYLKQIALNNNLESYPQPFDRDEQTMTEVDEVSNDGWLQERITLWLNAKKHIRDCHLKHAELVDQKHCDLDALTGEDEASKQKLEEIKNEEKMTPTLKKNMESLIKQYMEANDELDSDRDGKKILKYTYELQGESQTALLTYHGPNRVAQKVGIRDMAPIIELAINLTLSRMSDEQKSMFECPIRQYGHEDFVRLFKTIWPPLFANIVGQTDNARRNAIINRPILKVADPNRRVKTTYRYNP